MPIILYMDNGDNYYFINEYYGNRLKPFDRV
jgi:hypothetical protein